MNGNTSRNKGEISEQYNENQRRWHNKKQSKEEWRNKEYTERWIIGKQKNAVGNEHRMN